MQRLELGFRRSGQRRDRRENRQSKYIDSNINNYNYAPSKHKHCDSSFTTLKISTALSSDDLSYHLTASHVITSPVKKTRRRTRRSKRRQPKNGTAPRVVRIAELTDEKKAQYIALDAEMVGIGPHGMISRLARICLVNYDGKTIYDTLVKVDESVTDYRTFVSGITAEDLESEAALPFIEVHEQVSSLIRNKIILGHGLKNDLRVLELHHPWYDVRDTAKYEPFMKPCTISPTGYKAKKLATLAKDKLGMIMQEDGQPHNPVEDAIAALELYKKHRVKWECAMQYKMNKTASIVALHN